MIPFFNLNLLFLNKYLTTVYIGVPKRYAKSLYRKLTRSTRCSYQMMSISSNLTGVTSGTGIASVAHDFIDDF
jgi:hypothetical protein